MISIQEDGFIEIEIGGIPQMVDIYRTYSEIWDARRKSQASEGGEIRLDRTAFYTEIHRIMDEIGFPQRSDRVADRFSQVIADQLEIIEKKEESAQSLSTTSD